MDNDIHSNESCCFSDAMIYAQLQDIFTDPIFAVSDILKRFLNFIVHETLEGRANQLKEYTIGLGVLNKPVNFIPQQDAIVRIHAGRLRRALNHYYQGADAKTAVFISIPKGSYVPVFSRSLPVIVDTPTQSELKEILLPSGAVKIGVMPFGSSDKAGSCISFAEGLSGQLSAEMAKIHEVTVISGFAMGKLAEKITSLSELIPYTGTQFIFTGYIQRQSELCRVHLQLIETTSSRQIWSQIFEKRVTAMNLFEVQDEVVQEVISMVRRRSFQDMHAMINPLKLASA